MSGEAHRASPCPPKPPTRASQEPGSAPQHGDRAARWQGLHLALLGGRAGG